MNTEEKAKAYDEVLERANKQRSDYQKELDKADKNSQLAGLLRAGISAIDMFLPELAESEDERIRKAIIELLKEVGRDDTGISENAKCMIAYLEKQKDESKAIEAVEKIDKYIDDHLANAHDMKDSNPDKKYYRGWDDALGKMAGILQDVYSNEKQKEQNLTLFNEPYNPDDYEVIMEGNATSLKKKEQKPNRERNKPKESWLSKTKYEIEHADELLIQRQEELREIRELKKQEQKPAEKQDYSGLNDFERAIHRGFLSAGVENVSVTIIKETAKECLAQMKPAEWSEEDKKMYKMLSSMIHGTFVVETQETQDKLLSWLKSLHPSWKPSEEQESVAEKFARIVRGNLIGIDKEVQQKFEQLYFEVTGNKMYGGYND